MKNGKIELSYEEYTALLDTLQKRFQENMNRHSNMKWEDLYIHLKNSKEKLFSLYEMERTGGEPDVLDYDKTTGKFIFYDCSPESPVMRRGACYDSEALQSRKKNKPENNVVDMAESMRVQILTEEQYRYLQTVGEFDLKTSSWIKTDEHIRKLGGALFCDRRYDTVFIYHNGAESYYSSRGFRASLTV